MKRYLTGVAALMLAAFLPPAASAQDYPTRPITMIIPYDPGGGGDYVGRAFAEELGKKLGQPVIVENHGGGATVIGSTLLARAAPDGYTIGLFSPTYVSNAFLLKNLPYRTPEDFRGVARVVTYPMALGVRNDLPAKNVAELVELARANPGTITNGNSGAGSGTDLATRLLSQLTGIQLKDIPFKGTGPSSNAIAGGHIDMGIAGITQLKPLADAGKLRILGSTGTQTMQTNPPIPAIAAEGVPDFEYLLWWGIFAPAGTPDAIVEKLNGALREVFADPAVIGRMENLYGEFGVLGAADFDAFIKAELELWGPMLRDAAN